uniref:MGAT4 family, member C n=1 Tax=Nannospalax galili TaxID=1026970 RepID=A0A8C6RNJ8_NANGA
MKTKNADLLTALVAILLFGFSCFCISRMNQTSKNHILELKKNMLHLKNKSENNHQRLVKVLNQMKVIRQFRCNSICALVPFSILCATRSISPTFLPIKDFKLFLPYLRKQGKIYPDVIIGKEKTGISFALGTRLINRKNHTHLKQTLTSVLSRMTPEEEQDSMVTVPVADTNEDYLNCVADMVKTKLKRQVKSGSLEVISIPAFFYPNMLYEKPSTEDSENLLLFIFNFQVKQALDFCILMLYAQPKAMYYLQVKICKNIYFTKIKDFINNITSKNWFYVEFSVLGFIGKIFRSEDLPELIHFFLMFYKVKPIDMFLDDFTLIKTCDWGESLRTCVQLKKEVHVQYRPSLFQYVGLYSSFPGREQHLRVRF